MHAPKGAGKQLVATLERIPAEHRDSWRMHRVGPGDTLASIGKFYGISAGAIASANHVSSPDQAEDGRLLIPASARAEIAPRRVASHSASVRATGSRATVHGKPTGKAAASIRRPPTRPNTTSALRRKSPVVVARASAR